MQIGNYRISRDKDPETRIVELVEASRYDNPELSKRAWAMLQRRYDANYVSPAKVEWLMAFGR